MKTSTISFFVDGANLCAKATNIEPVDLDPNDPLRQWTKAALVYAQAIAEHDDLVPNNPTQAQERMTATLTLEALNTDDLADLLLDEDYDPDEDIGGFSGNGEVDFDEVNEAMIRFHCDAIKLELNAPDYTKIGFRAAPAVRLGELTTRAVLQLLRRKSVL